MPRTGSAATRCMLLRMKLNMYVKTTDEPLFHRLRDEAAERGLSLSSALAEAARLWLKEPDPEERLMRLEERIHRVEQVGQLRGLWVVTE